VQWKLLRQYQRQLVRNFVHAVPRATERYDGDVHRQHVRVCLQLRLQAVRLDMHPVDGLLHERRLCAAEQWRRDLRYGFQHLHRRVQQQLYEMWDAVHSDDRLLH
jgi:hypothetical protein